jgi:3-oxoacyl-[acyl-carrier protein] reductase
LGDHSSDVDLGLADRACIVTGASSGIGLATARMLSHEGARVLMIGRNERTLTEAAGSCPGAQTLAADVTDAEAPERVLAACEERLGQPWALVNAAGGSRARPLEELSDADWQQQWELHVMGPMRLMRAVAPRMADAGAGRVVNVSSSSGKRPSLTLDASYSVTKAAELSLSRVFADAYAARGVLVNAVTPGPVTSPAWAGRGGLAEEIAERQGSSRDDVLEATHGRVPIGRMGTEVEIAAVICFLCSEMASNVAGAAWSVDGGTVQTIL